MQDYQFRIGQGILQLPWWWFDAMLAWLGVMGVILYFFGRRLVRPMFGVMGLIGGSVAMLIIGKTMIEQRWPGSPTTVFICIAAAIGALIAYWLWRLGVGVLLAITIAVVLPTAFMVWRDVPGPPIREAIEQVQLDLDHVMAESAKNADDPKKIPPITEPLRIAKDRIDESVGTWWRELSSGTRWLLGSLCFAGATAGLMLGFAIPVHSSAMATALIGTLFMVGGIVRLATIAGQSAISILPTQPQNILLTILIAAAVGSIFQTFYFRSSVPEP